MVLLQIPFRTYRYAILASVIERKLANPLWWSSLLWLLFDIQSLTSRFHKFPDESDSIRILLEMVLVLYLFYSHSFHSNDWSLLPVPVLIKQLPENDSLLHWISPHLLFLCFEFLFQRYELKVIEWWLTWVWIFDIIRWRFPCQGCFSSGNRHVLHYIYLIVLNIYYKLPLCVNQ